MTWQMSQAQAFRVSSFGLLETDLTARVHPEKDLNGDACALIKVVMDKHFEFSGPLGIVKRIEKTAEIWLYVPAGTERLTISHPQWGMIRDYLLPMPLKGLATYEMCLEAVKQEVKPSETNPEVSVAEPAKTVVANLSDKDTTTVDSHAVLVAETPLHPSNPSSHFVLQLNAGYSSSLMLGATAAYLSSSVGAFIRYSSNWKSISDSGLSCSTDGDLDEDENEQQVATDDEADLVTNSTFSKQVTINFGSSVAISNPYESAGVSVSYEGNYVTVTSTAEDVEYVLSGTTTAGCFKIYSDNKFMLTLDGVSITSGKGAAINVQSHKRVFVNLPSGTSSKLVDASSYQTDNSEDQKGAFFSEGQLIFNGTGALSITGNYKHAEIRR